MRTERWLIGIPLLLLAILLQSALWVPTQERQGDISPARREKYLFGSIGDAEILNPILHADSSSGEICGAVFDGLLDRDENLNYRGRLARSWRVYEEIIVPAPNAATAGAWKTAAQRLKKVTDVAVLGAPTRLKLTLSQVDQDFLASLKPIVGDVSKAEHNPVIEFTLRDNVRFHDGHAFSADDVKFTYDAIMNPANLSPRTSDYEPVKEVSVLDPLHVRVVYKRLYSPAIGTWEMGILPKHLLDEAALKQEAAAAGKDTAHFSLRDSAFNRRPIGTGAFKFGEWKTDQYIKLLRNDDYWDGAPGFREAVFRVIPDALGLETEFYAGTLDIFGARPQQVERLKSDERFQNFSGLSKSYSYIAYNMRRPIFKDARVRRALGMAIDVDPIVKYLYYGRAERTTGPFLKQTAYYDKSIAPLPYDPQAALELLRQAGWEKNAQGQLVNKATGEPMRFTLMTNNANDLRQGIMTIAQQAWEKLGISVELQNVEWTVFLQKHINQGNFDAIVLGWSMGIEPDLYQIWHSSQAGPKQLNFVGYNNPKADELIVRIRQEYNEEKLVEYCHALHRIIFDDQPYTFLTTDKWTVLLDKNIVRRVASFNGFAYQRIHPTVTGSYDFYFNQWVKVPSNVTISP